MCVGGGGVCACMPTKSKIQCLMRKLVQFFHANSSDLNDILSYVYCNIMVARRVRSLYSVAHIRGLI